MSAEASSASSSSSDSSEKIQATKKASDLLAEGTRNMVCGEIQKAVNLYEEAVQLLVKSCGELSRDCADAYFSCGSALLELGRMETSVLGAALEGVDVEEEKEEEVNEQFEKPSESEGEERQKLRDDVYKAMAEGEREKELKSAIVENSKMSCAEGDVKVCDKSKESVDSNTNGTCEGKDGSQVNQRELTKNSDSVGADKKDDLNIVASDEIRPTAQSDNSLFETSGVEKMSVPNDESTVTDRHNENTEKSDNTTDVEKQANSDQMIVEACKEGADENIVNSCREKSKLSGDAANAGEKCFVSETGVKSVEAKAKVADGCEDVEMADKDAPEEVDADAEEDEDTAEDKDIQDGEEIEGEEKEEDVPNFQLAWEYLDLAKVIYLKCESREDQLKAAECYIKLGELSMETEQHVTAAEDLESALKIQQKLLSADDRLIAETHYQLGLAYGLGKEFDLSIQHYTDAINVIEAKIASLNKLAEEAAVDESNKENHQSDQVKKYQDEVKELQELVPEMRNKIEDAREEAKVMEKMKEMAKEALGFSGSSKKFDSPTKRIESNAGDKKVDVDENGEKKATDIAHLIRKKRKPEDESQASSDQEVKKIRHDSSGGDIATANGPSGGGSVQETSTSGQNRGSIQETSTSGQNNSEPTTTKPTSS